MQSRWHPSLLARNELLTEVFEWMQWHPVSHYKWRDFSITNPAWKINSVNYMVRCSAVSETPGCIDLAVREEKAKKWTMHRTCAWQTLLLQVSHPFPNQIIMHVEMSARCDTALPHCINAEHFMWDGIRLCRLSWSINHCPVSSCSCTHLQHRHWSYSCLGMH